MMFAGWHLVTNGPQRIRSLATIAALTLLLCSGSGWAQNDEIAADVPEVEAIVDAEAPIEEDSKIIDIAAGCAAGAVAGSVLPGLGNLVGCAVGGVGAWIYKLF